MDLFLDNGQIILDGILDEAFGLLFGLPFGCCFGWDFGLVWMGIGIGLCLDAVLNWWICVWDLLVGWAARIFSRFNLFAKGSALWVQIHRNWQGYLVTAAHFLVLIMVLSHSDMQNDGK